MRRKKLNKRSFWDKFSYSNRNTNIFLVCVFLFLLFGLTIGYSVLSNVLSIKGDIAVRPVKDIRITNVEGPTLSNGAYENANFRYSSDLLVVNGVLPSTSSSLSYTITIKNNGTADMDLVDIINSSSDSNVYYELSGFTLGDTIEAGQSITFTLILKTSSGSDNAFTSQLQFVFEESYIDITTPTVTFTPMPTDDWSKSDYTVIVSVTDDVDVTSLMYCKSETDTCTPTTVSTVDTFNVTIDTSSDKNTICVLASDSSKYGPNSTTICTNKDGEYYKLDKVVPTISPTVSGTTGNNGWYKSDVVFTVNGYDALSLYKGHKYQTSTDNGSNYSTLSDYTTSNIALSTECVNNKVKITGYDNALNASETYTSDTIKIDKTSPVITVDGHTSNYTVEYVYEKQETANAYETGTAVYFNPVSGEMCDDYVEANSLNENVGATTDTECMKWYIIGEDTDSIDMILDHNTTYTSYWNSQGYTDKGPEEIINELNLDTMYWTGVPARTDSYTDPAIGYTISYNGLRARLIEANEIAKITGADKALQWDSSKTYGSTVGTNVSYYYLDGKYGTDSTWQTEVATSQGASKYAWLFDYTGYCTSSGCNISDNETFGYWTSSAVAGYSDYAWYVGNHGRVNLDSVAYVSDFGVRPVITIEKDTSSSYTIPTGTASDNCSGTTTVTSSGSVNTSVLGSYPVNYSTTDEAGNSKTLTMTVNVVDKNAPTVNFNPEAASACYASDFQVTISADDDLEVGSFLWCQTTGNNGSCTPTTVGDPSGTTVDINTDSEYHVICAQATDTSNNITTKCSNYDGKYYALDKTGPTMSTSISPTSADGSNEWYKTVPTVTVGNTTSGCALYTGYKYELSVDGGSTYGSLSSLQTDDTALNNEIASNECKSIKYKVTGYDGNNHASSTITSSTIKFDKTEPTITVDGNTSSYEVEFVPGDITIGGEVYFNPVTGQACNDYVEANSLNENNTGCMRWYVLNNGDDGTVDLLLDHNTTKSVAWDTNAGATGPVDVMTELNNDTSGWLGVADRTDSYSDYNQNYTFDYTGYKARLIEGEEIANLENYSAWDSTYSANNFGISTNTWLTDYMSSCSTYGCHAEDSTVTGYWTVTAPEDYVGGRNPGAWGVTNGGVYVDDVTGSDNGVRPVITVNADILTTYTVPTATATDNCGEEVTVTTSGTVNVDVPGSYPITYTATDQAGNTKTLTLTVKVKDTIPPVLTVDGNTSDYSVEVIMNESSFTLPTGSATDNAGTATVTTSGSVNLQVAGSYPVVYTATDESGNTTSLTLTVIVQPVQAVHLEYTNTSNTSCGESQCAIDELFDLLG